MKRRTIFRKWTAMVLSALLCICLPVTVMAAETVESAASAKEEVIYTRLAADGSPLNTYVVNIFSGGDVTDYGSYSSVKILNTTDEITQNNDKITFASSADRVYYQGDLPDAELPWNISVRYFLDGEEYAPEEIAGASGALEIRFEIEKNENCNRSFYDTYALQASFTLNTELCSNIQAEGATVANVGNEKQITYTILPGAGISAVITAEVTDFEMDAVSINGIRMNLDIDIDDEELMEQIAELNDAVGEIDDGTGEVGDGVGTLREGVEEELQAGTAALDEGVGELQRGTGALVSGAEEVSAGATALDEGAGELQSEAGTLVTGGEEVSAGTAALASGADTLDEGVRSLNSGISQMQSGLDALNEQTAALTGGSAQMKAALQLLQTELSGISASADEIQELVSASSAVKQGISDLSDGASALQSSISYEAYKTAMAGYGLDIDTLLAGNESGVSAIEETIVQLQTLRDALAESESALAMPGLSADTIDQYIALLEQTETLLNGNTAAIQGMESYLNAANADTAELAAGAAELKESYEAFDAAIGSLADTLTNLLYDMTELKDAVDTLVEEYTGLDSGLTAYTDGVAQIVAGYSRISDGAASLASGSSELVSAGSTLYSGTSALLAGIEELYDASGTLKTGTGELAGGTAELLTGMTQLYDASGTLKVGTGELTAGAAELLTGIDALYDGIGGLKAGTGKLAEETSDMDGRVEEQINEILDSISGGNEAAVSFVSEKNTEVSSVQFVIQTEAIEAAEPETVTEAEEDLTFWQRILRLFGLY